MLVLVTGCAGFIGSRVCSLLSKRGNEVIGIDNLNDAYDVRLKKYRLDCLSDERNFTFYKADITERQNLEACLNNHRGIDTIVNLAARAGVRSSLDIPSEYYTTNLMGTLNLLEFSKSNGISKFVQASTSSVYGENEYPFHEEQNTDFMLSPYASSKKASENLCYTYHRLYGMDVFVLRYFTVYGPAGRPDMAPFRFIRWVDQGDDVIVYGDGNQKRDFTYVDDIAEGTVSAVSAVEDYGFEIINLGSDAPVKLTDFIKLIEKKLGKKARVVSQPFHITDVPATWANTLKAKEVLNWVPRVDIESGLDLTVDWYMKNKDIADSIEL